MVSVDLSKANSEYAALVGLGVFLGELRASGLNISTIPLVGDIVDAGIAGLTVLGVTGVTLVPTKSS